MKTTVNIHPKNSGQKFPLLARSKYDNTIVLFSSDDEGTIVVPGDSGSRSIGTHSKTWRSIEESGNWIILPPGSTVTLEQE